MARGYSFSGQGLPVERTVFGTREDAETEVRSMINAWLKKRSATEEGSKLK
jgi:hypothetical protein